VNFIQSQLYELQEKGWTLAALADKIGLTVNTLEKWKAGDNKPRLRAKTYSLLDKIKNIKRIPKKKRYSKKRYIIV
jgi:transcriptional regulator with XRE-family HTH domain